MSLAAGTRLGPYEIVALLGQGGMGSVYKARDTQLDRLVAIKVLTPGKIANDERKLRFVQEAKAASALNHPNIVTIYNIGNEDGVDFIAMEFVAGRTLDRVVPSGGMKPAELLKYAIQGADALARAHAAGIVHRDLKPGNIMISDEGQVKLVDFGLAKLSDLNETSDAELTRSDAPQTEEGQIVGTVCYMSPEQAEARKTDARSDIFSFGAVLYEMATGRRAFMGRSKISTLAAILQGDPTPAAELNARVPRYLARIIQRCLRKDPAWRYQSAADLKISLCDLQRDMESGTGDWQEPARPATRRWRPAAVATGALAIVSLVLAGWLWRATRLELHPLARFSVEVGPEASLDSSEGSAVVISPDGARMAFVVRPRGGAFQIATRLLDQANPSVLPGTENGLGPFFSPDGQWLGFFAGGKMKKVSVHGGPVTTLCDAPGTRGASWGSDGYIVANLTLGGGLFRVPEGGGTPQALTNLAITGEATHRWPEVLPGGEAVLFTGHTITANYDEANIEVLSLKSGKWKIVQRGGYYGRYAASGHLLYVRQSTLYAAPFDLNRLEVRGAAVPLLDDVAGYRNNGAGQFSARNGMLLYFSNRSTPASWPVAWLDRTGQQEPIAVDPARYTTPRISPDGGRLAMTVMQAGGGGDIMVYDFQRQSVTRLTFSHNNSRPVWAPDGKHIAFVTEASKSLAIRWVRADGAGDVRTLFEDRNEMDPWSFSPDGRLAFAWVAADASYHLWTLPLDLGDPDNPKPGPPEPFLRTPFREMQPAFSPDGRWVAYVSGESPPGIYVRRFPPAAGADSAKWQISTGGRVPMWSRNSPELFYEDDDGQLMTVGYSTEGDSFAAIKPRPWSNQQIPPLMVSSFATWDVDVAPDGKRFVMFPKPEKDRDAERSVHVTMLLNFFDELRRRVPVR